MLMIKSSIVMLFILSLVGCSSDGKSSIMPYLNAIKAKDSKKALELSGWTQFYKKQCTDIVKNAIDVAEYQKQSHIDKCVERELETKQNYIDKFINSNIITSTAKIDIIETKQINDPFSGKGKNTTLFQIKVTYPNNNDTYNSAKELVFPIEYRQKNIHGNVNAIITPDMGYISPSILSRY